MNLPHLMNGNRILSLLKTYTSRRNITLALETPVVCEVIKNQLKYYNLNAILLQLEPRHSK